MATATLQPAPAPAAPPAVAPRPMLFTCAEFHDLGESGAFAGRRPILVNGVILEQGPMNPPHAIAGTNTEDLVRDLFGRGFHVRVQKPLVLGLSTDPEPDVAVLPGRPADYRTHPATAALVIEISDTTLRYDTGEKMSLYAAAGIPEFWVLDINGRQLLVYRDPGPDAAAEHGHSYTTRMTFADTATATPLAAAGAIAVAGMLP